MDIVKSEIIESVKAIQRIIPPGVIIMAAAKTRSLAEVETVIEAGVIHIGYNYIQEALPIMETIGTRAVWHMIGHLQRNKVKIAAQYFDMIDTIDSLRLAQTLERHCEERQKKMPVLVEINSGRESNKTGIMPEEVDELIEQISGLHHLQVEGLMTMGPRFGDPEDSRPYYKTTRAIFERLSRLNLPNVKMKTLSMGMSNSYQVAIEEGANMIRIGTKLFGERNQD